MTENNESKKETLEEEKFTMLDSGCAVCKFWEGNREFLFNGSVRVKGDGIHSYGRCSKQNIQKMQATGLCNVYTPIK